MTQREKQMLCLIRDGISNEEMASKLGIKNKTIYTHRRNLMIKLGCENRMFFQNSLLRN
ncbi:helix-turn-helix domain-containing protein [Yersinia aleksiciae]|uniref:helix-turn-helix domain-containing protein n=1 Tax=Yersinia aleksiciae TaxID=263819 RepID=UPI0036F41D90